MSQITENTIIIDKERVAELKEFLLERRFAHDSIKEIYQDPYGKCLLTFDYNGSPTEDNDWPFSNILIETDYGEDDLWTRNDNGDIDDTIQSQIQKGLLFPELHNNNELFNKVMHNLEYNIGGLHGNDLYNLKPINNLLDNLTKQQKELLLSAVNEFDEGQVSDYKSFNALKEDIENNILHIAYTTAGDDEEYEIQVDFDFSTMCYKQYVDNELIVTDSRIDRDFYSFCEELRICRFDEMISDCVDSAYEHEHLNSIEEGGKDFNNMETFNIKDYLEKNHGVNTTNSVPFEMYYADNDYYEGGPVSSISKLMKSTLKDLYGINTDNLQITTNEVSAGKYEINVESENTPKRTYDFKASYDDEDFMELCDSIDENLLKDLIISNKQIVGNDGLLESKEETITINNTIDNDLVDVDKELEKHGNLQNKIGNQEYLRCLWYMEQKDLIIDDVIDNNGNYRKDLVDDYYQDHEEPSNETWLKYLDVLGDKVSGLSEFLRDLNKGKDGKDREFTTFKSRSMNK